MFSAMNQSNNQSDPMWPAMLLESGALSETSMLQEQGSAVLDDEDRELSIGTSEADFDEALGIRAESDFDEDDDAGGFDDDDDEIDDDDDDFDDDLDEDFDDDDDDDDFDVDDDDDFD
jgi:hypothetical protein